MTALRRDDPTLLPDLRSWRAPRDVLGDDDLQLSLWTCYELHYQGFDLVADQWEWAPDLIRARGVLEEGLMGALRQEVAAPSCAAPIAERLRTLVDGEPGLPLSRFMQRDADLEQFREFAIHRSIYQLKEADPHTWAIPRLTGRAKSALVEIQTDEYGGGDVGRMHSELYRGVLRGLGLDQGYGAYINSVPGITLAVSNVMSLFGLHRAFRGALVGQLAAYEMTSSEPCRRYAQGLRRLSLPDESAAFYDVHVMADALHEQLAAHDLCGALAADQPELADQIMFGAATSLHVDNRFAEHLMSNWSRNETSLRSGEARAQEHFAGAVAYA